MRHTAHHAVPWGAGLRWPLASLRTYLHVITLAAVLPLALLTSWLIGKQVELTRHQLSMGLRQGASSMAMVIEREQAATVEALMALARSPQVQRGDTRAFDRLIKTYATIRPAWRRVSLVDVSRGRVISSTSASSDAPDESEAMMAPEPQAGVASDADPYFSDLLPGAREGEWLTRITVPVWRGDEVRYHLVADIDGRYWQELIASVSTTQDGFTTLYDSSKVVIARTVNPLAHIGRPVPSDVPGEAIEGRNRQTGFRKIHVAGEGEAYVAWQTIPSSNWGVRVGVTATPLDRNKMTAFLVVVGAGVASLLAGLMLSRFVAARIIKPLGLLAAGDASTLADADASVFEIAMLRDAMLAAAQQRDLATQRLEAKAAEFETLFLLSPIGMSITLDPHCDHVLRNPAKLALFGMDSSGPPSYKVLVNGVVIPEAQYPLMRAARGERIHDLEMEVQHLDGRVFRLLAYALPLLDQRGRPRGAIATFVDITERVQSQHKLLQAQARLEDNQHFITLAQRAGDVGFWDHRVDANRITMTSGLTRLMGMGQGESETSWEGWVSHIRSPDPQSLAELLRHAWSEHQEQVTFQLQIEHGGQPERWLACRGVCVYDSHGQPVRVIGAVVDVTAQHQVEHERTRLMAQEQVARREAEQANRAKDEFLAILGHELRNPLGAISAGIEVLDRISAQGGQPARVRTIIARQTRHLTRLMDDLLDVARVIAGKIQLSVQPVSVRATVQRAVNALNIAGLTQNVEIDVDDVWVQADSLRLEQIINNLVTNAGKYSPPDLTIHVIGKREGDRVRLQVINRGALISPSLLPHIFDLFVQGERTIERRQGGLGIGLTLVKSLVDLHHGSIDVSTADDRNVFTVMLPAAEPEESQPEGAMDEQPHRRTVVIVEDNDDAREAVRLMLQVKGHLVEAWPDGDEGLRAILETQPDLALVDIGLPGQSGYEVARAARTAGFEGWMIALSGYGQQQDVQRALSSGFDFHMVKPLDPVALDAYLFKPPRNRRTPEAV